MGTEMTKNITLDLEQTFGDLNECVIVTNPERTIVFVNQAMSNLLKVDREKVVGTTTKRFFADPNQFAQMAELYQSPTDHRNRKAYSIDLALEDGSTVSVEVVSAPLFDTDHTLTGILFIAREASSLMRLKNSNVK